MTPRQLSEAVRYLRQHALGLTGTPEAADAFLRASVDIVAAEPERYAGDRGIALLSLLNEVWAAVAAACKSGPNETGANEAVRHGIAALPPRERQLVLLTLVEGFSLSGTAHLLGVSRDEVFKLFDDSCLELQTAAAD